MAGVAVLFLAATGSSWARLSPVRSATQMGLATHTGQPTNTALSVPLAPPAEPSASSNSAMTPAEAFALNASRPVSTLPNPAAAPLHLIDETAQDRARAVDCLAAAVYYEAASEDLRGRRAVAQVVLNRLARPAFPKTVCGVVFQGANLATGCQFTFTCDGSLNRAPSVAGWSAARDVATAALAGFVEPSVGGATHYHTVWVSPYWSGSLIKVATLGAHVFYVWPSAGAPDRSGGVRTAGEPDPALVWNIGRAPFGSSLAVADADPAEPDAPREAIVMPAQAVTAPRPPALITAAPLADTQLTRPPGYKVAQLSTRPAGDEHSRLPVPEDW